jgi:hypothetical protein
MEQVHKQKRGRPKAPGGADPLAEFNKRILTVA